MTYESPHQPERETQENFIDPDFRFSEGAYDWLLEQIAKGRAQMPGLLEFLEKHKPDRNHVPQGGFTPEDE